VCKFTFTVTHLADGYPKRLTNKNNLIVSFLLDELMIKIWPIMMWII